MGVGGFVLALWLQLRAERYRAPVHRSCVSMIAVFGTMLADVARVATGLPLWATSSPCAVAVAVMSTWWRAREGTLDVHSITTARRERSCWATVLATFAPGTAVGDLTGIATDLGCLPSGILFGVAILLPLLAWRLGANPVATFWAAYVPTRPLGASFADWLSTPAGPGHGLGLGDGPVTLAAVGVIVLLVGYLTLRRNDIQPGPGPTPRGVARAVEEGEPA